MPPRGKVPVIRVPAIDSPRKPLLKFPTVRDRHSVISSWPPGFYSSPLALLCCFLEDLHHRHCGGSAPGFTCFEYPSA